MYCEEKKKERDNDAWLQMLDVNLPGVIRKDAASTEFHEESLTSYGGDNAVMHAHVRGGTTRRD